jgi:hypothetical protein
LAVAVAVVQAKPLLVAVAVLAAKSELSIAYLPLRYRLSPMHVELAAQQIRSAVLLHLDHIQLPAELKTLLHPHMAEILEEI